LAFKVELSRAAKKALARLPREAQERIVKALVALGQNPKPRGHRKLSGSDNLYQIRIGNYRVIYTVKADQLLVLVVKIGHRREIYR